MTYHVPSTTRPVRVNGAFLLSPARPTMSPARALRLLRLRSVYRNVRASLSMPAREAFGVARFATS